MKSKEVKEVFMLTIQNTTSLPMGTLPFDNFYFLEKNKTYNESVFDSPKKQLTKHICARVIPSQPKLFHLAKEKTENQEDHGSILNKKIKEVDSTPQYLLLLTFCSCAFAVLSLCGSPTSVFPQMTQ